MSALPPQQFLPLTEAPRSRFLSLAPATSASYPKTQARTHARAASIPTAADDAALALRRSSTSSSSSSSNSGGYRVLKLGPVHWGEHPEEHKGDFHYII